MIDTMYWNGLEKLVESCEIVIDRPKGTAHKSHPDMIYPLDYGYLKGTKAGDGGGIDVWLGSMPEKSITAIVLTTDLEKRDIEVKIMRGCTPEELQSVVEFHNYGSMTAMLVKRE